MGIPEPAGPLWTVVKAIHDPWPPDDETRAAALGAQWVRGAGLLDEGAAGSAEAGRAVQASWRDPAGAAFDGRLGEFQQTAGQVREQTLTLAAQAETYAGELASAKSVIVSTIGANEGRFALITPALFGPSAPSLQLSFAAVIARYLQDMIAQKAAALRADPTQPAPLPPPPPELTIPEPGGLDDVAADAARGIGELGQLAWLTAGDAVDGYYDAAGEIVGGAVGGVGDLVGSDGLRGAGDGIRQAGDAFGDVVAEEALGIGSDIRSEYNHLATAIDGDREPITVYVNGNRYPESAGHIDDAQNGTSYKGEVKVDGYRPQPSELTLDRENAEKNRKDSLRGIPPAAKGYDRDEYPPATFREGGKGASVKNIPQSDNRGAGASIGYQLNHYTAKDSVDRQSRRLDNGETVVIETYY
jgi:hypothetical protein